MFRVSPNHLLWILEGLVEGKIHNQIIVPDEMKRGAKLALDRMLAVRTSATVPDSQLELRRREPLSSEPGPERRALINPLLKETAEWRTKFHRFPTTTTPWSRTSTSRRCGSTTTSITPRT